MFYSPSTNGFYDYEINGKNIPKDAVEITEDQHKSLLDGQSQGKWIAAGKKGIPMLQDAPALSDEQLATNARVQRDALLSACDWTVLPDAKLSNQGAWETYRQALRDVPQQKGFPQTITWPAKP